MSFISQILGSAKDDIVNGALGAINQIGRGDLDEAVNSITRIVPNIAENVGSRDGVAFGNGFAGIHSRQDAVQDWNWYCVLPNVGGKQLPWYYVVSANTPQRKFNVETLARNGHKVHLPESYELSGNLSLKLFVDTSSRAADYAKAWSSAVLGYNDPAVPANQGVWGMPVDFKKTVSVVLMSPDRKDLITFKYLKCWPSDPSAFELGSGSGNPMELQLDLQVEDVEVTIRNAQGLLDNLGSTARGVAYSAISGGVSDLINGFRSTSIGAGLARITGYF